MQYSDINIRLVRLERVRHIIVHKEASKHALYKGQLPLLEFILHHEGCTQKQIADMLKVSPASIALSTKRMQKAGLLAKETDSNNLRCNRLYVTEKGKTLSSQCREKLNAINQIAFQNFSVQEMDLFCQMLDRCLANMEPLLSNTDIALFPDIQPTNQTKEDVTNV